MRRVLSAVVPVCPAAAWGEGSRPRSSTHTRVRAQTCPRLRTCTRNAHAHLTFALAIGLEIAATYAIFNYYHNKNVENEKVRLEKVNADRAAKAAADVEAKKQFEKEMAWFFDKILEKINADKRQYFKQQMENNKEQITVFLIRYNWNL